MRRATKQSHSQVIRLYGRRSFVCLKGTRNGRSWGRRFYEGFGRIDVDFFVGMSRIFGGDCHSCQMKVMVGMLAAELHRELDRP